MKPLRDIVVIQAEEPKQATDSGILIVETWKTYPQTGKVIAIGPEVTMDLVGKTVLFERYGSIRVNENHQDYRMCKQSHIMAVIDE